MANGRSDPLEHSVVVEADRAIREGEMQQSARGRCTNIGKERAGDFGERLPWLRSIQPDPIDAPAHWGPRRRDGRPRAPCSALGPGGRRVRSGPWTRVETTAGATGPG